MKVAQLYGSLREWRDQQRLSNARIDPAWLIVIALRNQAARTCRADLRPIYEQIATQVEDLIEAEKRRSRPDGTVAG